MKWNVTHLAYCRRLSELTRLRSEHVGMRRVVEQEGR
jgi:hypothetical protein